MSDLTDQCKAAQERLYLADQLLEEIRKLRIDMEAARADFKALRSILQ
jgi:hypothetical protein